MAQFRGNSVDGGVWKVLLLMVVLLMLHCGEVRSKVSLVDQGYKGVVVAISPYIKQNDLLLHRLQKYLTETSKTMFQATRNQLYFKEIAIIVPETWKGINNVENALDFPMDVAQFIIDHPNAAYGDAPYVKQYAECGQPGLYIHLTPSYLVDDNIINKWGPPEKTLVHEWAHLRWGLFDEYPIDPQDSEFYRQNGEWHATRCTTEVDGKVQNKFTKNKCAFDFFTGKPEKACLFFPQITSNKAAASLMFMQYLESIVEFCDDPVMSAKPLRHNTLAPNRQNRLCAYRSAWEVMRKHEDFRTVKPLSEDTDTTPVFRFVQVKPKKRVLVLDTSGSMTGSSLSVMMQAASSYILSCIETGSSLGIVQFNTNATILSTMVRIHTENDRLELIKKLPRLAEGKTSIGAGLDKGLQLLNSIKDKENGQGSIILITDGKENERPFLTDFQPKILSKGVKVHSLSYGQRADQSIAQLAKKSGGKLYFYSGRKGSTGLMDGLAATVTTLGSIPHTEMPVSILTDARTVFAASPHTGTFMIDASVGRDTSITISHSDHIAVSVISPNDVTMTSLSHPTLFRDDTFSEVLKIALPGAADIGKWTYIIETNASQADITVSIQSKARTPDTEVVQITSWLSSLPDNNSLTFDVKQKITVFAELIRGRSPVLEADVTAILERPLSNTPLKISLHDNGIGSDIIRGDGIYSAYVLAGDLLGNGRYSLKIEARGVDGSTVVVKGGRGRFSGALGVTDSGMAREVDTEQLDVFERVTSAGEFRVAGYPVLKNNKSVAEEEGDKMTPSRITDLHVLHLDPDSGQAAIRWTAVGDDMDRGIASRYVVQVSEEFDALFTLGINQTAWTREDGDFNLHNNTPQPAGHTELANLTLYKLQENMTLFLSLRAVDENDNAGDLSNVVTLSRARVLAVPIEDGAPDLEFYLKIIIPFVATVVLFFCFLFLVVRSCRREGKTLEDKQRAMSVSTYSLDMSYMNYRYDGQYRERHSEVPDETWSTLGKSVESLDRL